MAPRKLVPYRRTVPMAPVNTATSTPLSSPQTPSSPPDCPLEPVPASAYFDLVIIGAGPAALALLARLMEKRPAALYLEDEHRFLHWLHSKDGSTGRKIKNQRGVPTVEGAPGAAPLLRTAYLPKSSERAFLQPVASQQEHRSNNMTRSSTIRSPRALRILVVDRIGGWMGLWNRLFAAYEIPHLRSPMFFHPSPADLDALVAYAERTGRSTQGTWQPAPLSGTPSTGRGTQANDKSTRPKKLEKSMRRKHKDHIGMATQLSEERAEPKGPELIEIRGCVGKEISKHRRKKARAQHHHNHGGNQLGAAVNERDRRDYFTPGTRLFQDFVQQDVVRRYGLPGGDLDQPWPALSTLLQELSVSDGQDDPRRHTPAMEEANKVQIARGEVKEMSWHHNLHIAGQGHVPAMLMRTADGSVLAAGTVVSAIGPGGVPNIPAVLRLADEKRAQAEAETLTSAAAATSAEATSVELPESASASTPQPPAKPFGQGWAHSAAFALPSFDFPPPSIAAKIKNEGQRSDCTGPTCVVIGGGLTSAQLCVLALRKGFGKVVLLLRGHLKVKPFDVTLDWLSKWANTMKMQFWQEDDPAERLAMLRSARDGGSITPSYARYLRDLERAGFLEIRTHVEIEDLGWEAEEEKWSVKLRCTTCADSDSSSRPDGTVLPPRDESALGAVEEDDEAVSAADHHDTCEPCPEPACTAEGSQGSDSDLECDDSRKDLKSQSSSTPITAATSDFDTSIEDDTETPSSPTTMNLLQADYILSSTGPVLSLTDLPAFETLARTHPIASFGGLPLVSEDLQWMSSSAKAFGTGNVAAQSGSTNKIGGVEGQLQQQPRLFVVGAYSALQLGPAAFNLGGMREAAERVGSRLLRDWEAEAEAELEMEMGADEDLVDGDEVKKEGEVTEDEEGEGEDVSDTSTTSLPQSQLAQRKNRTERSQQQPRREPWQTGRWSALAQDDALLMSA
ncbi:hypothetical protein CF326_g316 [Tilletia indica]|nr:hypothetical protein CF326_g316 [Tilletia indica]